MAQPLLPHPPAGSPRRFLRAWLLGVLLLVVVAIPALDLLLLSWRSDPQVAWIEGIARRKTEAAQVADNHRLLIAGGSSGVFSVDAEFLQARFDRPACNLSTHAGLGLSYLLEDVRAVAQPGDTVLLYLEYAHYSRRLVPLSPLERQALWTSHPERLFHLPLREAFLQIYGNPLAEYQLGWTRRNAEMTGSANADEDLRPYSTVELGPCGDYRSSAPSKPPAPLELRRLNAPRAEAAARLASFFQWCRKSGVQAVGIRPAIARDPAATPAEVGRAYTALEKFYREQNVPLLDTRDVFQLPVELFYDTEYHATAAGRRLITEAIARSLAPHLAQAPPEQSGPILLLASAGSSGRRDFLLAEQSNITSRFLSATDLHHPLCVTPTQVRQLCESDRAVHYVDPEVRSLLEVEGLTSFPVPQRSTTFSLWVQQYPDHLFLLAQVGDFSTAPLASQTPPRFSDFLQHPGPKAAILGTGRCAHIHEARFAEASVELRVSPRVAWQRGAPFPVSITLLSGAAIKTAPIFIEHSALCAGLTPGLAVAVYDPARGIVVQRGVFTGPAFLEWQLMTVRPAPAPHAL